MTVSKEFLLKNIAGDYIVVPTGNNMVDFGSIISLNETGAFLWEKLQNDCSIEDLVGSMLLEYDVDRSTAIKDIEEFINLLKVKELLQ